MVALPFLESWQFKRTFSGGVVRAQAAPAPLRMISYFVPTGHPMTAWMPAGATEGGALPAGMSPILAPLATAALRPKTTIVRGLGNPMLAWDHPYQIGGALNCTGPNTVSFDQLIAATTKAHTPNLPSLHVGIHSSTDRLHLMSWESTSTSVNPESNPQTIFNRIFAGYDPDATSTDQNRRAALGKSVLDYVVQDAKSLTNQLSAEDKIKVDAYFTSLQELESRVTQNRVLSCEVPSASGFANTSDIPAKHKALLDLMALAVACDATRVITFFWNGGNDSYPWIGVNNWGHHDISHASDEGNASARADYQKISEWHLQQFAYFVSALNSIDEGGATALDNSLVYMNSEMSESHNYADTPILLLGGGGGKIKTGRYIRIYDDLPDWQYGDGSSLGNLYMTFFRAFGMNVPSFSRDGTRALTELLT